MLPIVYYHSLYLQYRYVGLVSAEMVANIIAVSACNEMRQMLDLPLDLLEI